MHRVKTNARRVAWDQDGAYASLNPFHRYKVKSAKKYQRTHGTGVDSSELANGGAERNTTYPPNIHNNRDIGGADHFESDLVGHSPGDLSDTEAPVGQAESSKQPTGFSNGSKSTGATGSSDPLSGEQRNRKSKKPAFVQKFFGHKEENQDPETGTHDPDAKARKGKFTVWSQIRYSLFNSWLNVLLVFAPIGIALSQVPTVGPIVVFVVNFIAIIPLAGTLSYATEEIALRVGETLGGLLNATFGNAVELIVSIIALFKDEIVIVQTSLIGSMLSNLLLVMGMCFFFGGINRKRQHFSGLVAQTAASLLALAIAALIIPTAFTRYADNPATTSDNSTVATNETDVSRGTSVLLLIVYICYLVFQLRTHEDIYRQTGKKVNKENLFRSEKSKKAKAQKAQDEQDEKERIRRESVARGEQDEQSEDSKQEEEDAGEDPTLSLPVAIFTLLWSTVLVAVCAEFLVDAINQVVESTGISRVFVGLILLPIVGNAAEHATALTVACKDKMDLAIGVAIGSSMQIALLVLPLVVVIGWIAHKPDMNLNFDPFDVIILFVAVLLVNYLISDGESHWLEGVMLMVLYIIIAVVAWFFPNTSPNAASAS